MENATSFLFTMYFPSVEQMHHGQERKKFIMSTYNVPVISKINAENVSFIPHASILSFKDQTPHNKYH